MPLVVLLGHGLEGVSVDLERGRHVSRIRVEDAEKVVGRAAVKHVAAAVLLVVHGNVAERRFAAELQAELEGERRLLVDEDGAVLGRLVVPNDGGVALLEGLHAVRAVKIVGDATRL